MGSANRLKFAFMRGEEGMSGFFQGAGAFLIAAAVALLITAYGQGLWGLLVIANLRFHPEVPWAAIVMAILLSLLILYLSGNGWPRSTSARRHALLRWNPIPLPVFGWAILAGVLADIALGGIWIAASDFIHIPPGITPKMNGYPLVTVLSFLIMGSIAAPVAEEAAFRGYAQGLLERAWRWAPAAIIGSSILFAASHVLQGLSVPKLSLYFLAGLIFGTVAWLTNSLYASMLVHSLADIEGFLVLWPHEAHRHALMSEGGHDPLFLPAVAAVAISGPLALLAFHRLARITAGARAGGTTRSNLSRP
jgi:membrane protease YdiL (CAAX protease family)